MAEQQWHPGRFVWHELFTPDVAKSKSFYEGLFGWTVDAIPMGPMTYHMLKKGEQGVGALLSIDVLGRQGLPPFWLGYVSVPSVDEAAKACAASGGLVAMPPTDIPNIGRSAMFGDPVHAYSSAWRSNSGDGPLPEPPPVGTFCWDELHTNDPDKVTNFYQKVYGWAVAPFGHAKDLWVFNAGEKGAASLMKSPQPRSYWLSYVAVEKLEVSRNRAIELGAKVFVEKVSIPTVGDISVVADNTGAAIGLFQASRS